MSHHDHHSTGLMKCACADCVCIVDTKQAVKSGERFFCSDSCSTHHVDGKKCCDGCACHG